MNMKPKQLDLGERTPNASGKPRFEQVLHRNHRYCNCEMPMTSKKWNDALGDFIVIRLCCMAKTVQKIAEKLGIDAPDLYEVLQFEPRWVWDCAELHQSECPITGTIEYVERGAPPAWLLERLRRKGIEVRNLKEGHERNQGATG